MYTTDFTQPQNVGTLSHDGLNPTAEQEKKNSTYLFSLCSFFFIFCCCCVLSSRGFRSSAMWRCPPKAAEPAQRLTRFWRKVLRCSTTSRGTGKVGFLTDGRLPADVMFVLALYSLPQRGHAPRIHASEMFLVASEKHCSATRRVPVQSREGVACGRSFRGLSENVSFCFELHVVIAE